jgi:hypothetical protein
VDLLDIHLALRPSLRNDRGALHGREADLRTMLQLARAAVGETIGDRPPPQRRSMRMIHLCLLLPVDLPVDFIVVLEQEEGASEAKRIERALSQP